MKKRSMGSHQSATMLSDTWLTPPDLLEKLGGFDLDPACPENMPWATAKKQLTPTQDGLKQVWAGRVFLNPPYGLQAKAWLKKLGDHGNGIALIFARTETEMFFSTVWNKADAVLFIEGRLYFHRIDGKRAGANAGAPSVLIAYGKNNVEILRSCSIRGKFIELKTP